MGISIFKSSGQEISRYLFVYLVYIGIAIAVRSQAHTRMSFVLNILPKKIKGILEIVDQFLFLGFCIAMFYQSMSLVKFSFEMGDLTPATGVPMYLIFLALPLGFALSSLHLILIIYEKVKYYDIQKKIK